MSNWSKEVLQYTRKVSMDVRGGGAVTKLFVNRLMIANIEARRFTNEDPSIAVAHDLGRVVAFIYGAVQSGVPIPVLLDGLRRAEAAFRAGYYGSGADSLLERVAETEGSAT